jgi:hypothetical protein
LASCRSGIKQIEGLLEQGVGENIWNEDTESNRRMEENA